MLEDLEQLARDLRVLGPVCHLGHLLAWGYGRAAAIVTRVRERICATSG
jgi:hypothetical protein